VKSKTVRVGDRVRITTEPTEGYVVWLDVTTQSVGISPVPGGLATSTWAAKGLSSDRVEVLPV
jgi:hypothetical protein